MNDAGFGAGRRWVKVAVVLAVAAAMAGVASGAGTAVPAAAQAPPPYTPYSQVWVTGLNQRSVIDFRSGAPVATCLPGAWSSQEGSASYTDADGTLRIYSSGAEVYGPADNLVAAGLAPSSGYSSTEGALVTPWPGSTTRFLLLNAPAGESLTPTTTERYFWNEIDFASDPNGVLVQSNQEIVQPAEWEWSSEASAAVAHSNGRDYWWVLRVLHPLPGNTVQNGIAVIPVTPDGPQVAEMVITPVTGAISDVTPQTLFGTIVEAEQSPPNEALLAIAMGRWGIQRATVDRSTGAIAFDPAVIGGGLSIVDPAQRSGYGVAWSPSGRYLYYARGSLAGSVAAPYRYDLDTNTEELIVPFTFYGKPKLGPDGRIYWAALSFPFLGVVNSPDAPLASVGFDPAGLALEAPCVSGYSLPNETLSTTLLVTPTRPELTVTKSSAPGDFTVGDVIDYTITATNTGDVALTDVVVADPLVPALACSPATPAALAPGEATTCTGGYAVTEADATAGTVVNMATATGAPPNSAPLISGSASISTPLSPQALTSRFEPLTPARILDTRPESGPTGYTGAKPAAGQTVVVQVTGRGGVPTDGVTAVVFNLTATEADAQGFMTVFPTGEEQPTTSNLNVGTSQTIEATDQTIPNLVTARLSPDGKASIYVQSGAHLIADVAGYYQQDATSAGGRFQPAPNPVRVLDTRPLAPVGYAGTKPAAGDTVAVAVAGMGGVPADAEAVVLNVTATEATAPGFVTVHPAGLALPWASNLNAVEGQTVANQVIVPVGAGGAVSLYTQSGAHLVADLAGWFTGSSAPEGTSGLYIPLSPERHLDTRNAGGLVPGGGTVTAPGTSATIPAGEVAALVANVTVTEPVGPGFVTVYPAGGSLPWASNLNVERAGQTIANHVTVGTGTSDGVDVYTFSGTNVVFDVFGWYTA